MYLICLITIMTILSLFIYHHLLYHSHFYDLKNLIFIKSYILLTIFVICFLISYFKY